MTPRLLILLLAPVILAQVLAMFQLPIVGDEPDDLVTLLRDIEGIPNFFVSEGMYGFDQGRLPHWTGAPLVALFEQEATLPLRFLFFGFYLLSLVICYRLMETSTNSRVAWIFTLLYGAGCYVASFSIFSMTTGDNLYRLFHLMSLLVFVRSTFGQRPGFDLAKFALISALCIASKLFGVFLLVSYFIYHLMNRQWSVTTQSPRPFWVASLGFLGFLGLLQVLPLPGGSLLGLALMAGLGYLGWLTWKMRNPGLDAPTPLLVFWSTTTLVSFCLTLIFSPIFLNLSNLPKVFEWFGLWDSGITVAKSLPWDMPVIIAMKLGFVSCVCIALALGWLLLRAGRPKLSHPLTLLFFVTAFHIAVVSSLSFRIAWYPLAVTPFLFLPIALLVNHLWGTKWLPMASLLMTVVLGDNLYRFFSWHPYGHYDGAQFGREYMGWNKAGFVTFEALPLVVKRLRELSRGSSLHVATQVVYVPKYNGWAAYLIDQELRKEGVTNITMDAHMDPITDPAFGLAPSQWILSSPVYHPKMEVRLKGAGFKHQENLSIKGIPLISLWKR